MFLGSPAAVLVFFLSLFCFLIFLFPFEPGLFLPYLHSDFSECILAHVMLMVLNYSFGSELSLVQYLNFC